MTDGLWACGMIGRAHGLKGEVYLELLPHGLEYLAGGEQFFLERPGAEGADSVGLARRGGTDQHPLLKLEGIETRDAAIGLHGAVVLAAGVALDEVADHYPVSELVGCRVVSGASELGVVEAVLMNPAHDILQIATPDGEPLLVPFVAELVDVDCEAGVVRVREGLL